MKKFISLFTTLSIVFGVLGTFTVFADETAADLEISTLEELEAFRDDVNNGNTYEGKTVKLTADIDMSETYGEGKESWTPIGYNGIIMSGNPTVPFAGTFDGCGHTISNMYINADSDVHGLFGENTGMIKNLAVNGSCTYYEFSGGIVGHNYGTVKSCSFSGEIFGKKDTADKYHGDAHIGGIAGANFDGTISDCYNTATITSDGACIAGIVGLDGGRTERCYNVGMMNFGDGGEEYYDSLRASISVGDGAPVTDCYYLVGTYNVGAAVGEGVDDPTIALTTEQFADKSNFANWDFDTVWKMDANLGRPVFQWETDTTAIHTHKLCNDDNCNVHDRVNFEELPSDFAGGELSEGNYYLKEDILLDTPITAQNGAEVNLCLNGCKLEYSAGYEAVISIADDNENVTINICDCSADESGEVFNSNTDEGYVENAITVENASESNTLNIYGGRFIGNEGCALYITMRSNTNVNIYGGKFISAGDDNEYGICAQSGNVSIHGGYFEGRGGIFANGCKLVIDGGVFNGDAIDIVITLGSSYIYGSPKFDTLCLGQNYFPYESPEIRLRLSSEDGQIPLNPSEDITIDFNSTDYTKNGTVVLNGLTEEIFRHIKLADGILAKLGYNANDNTAFVISPVIEEQPSADNGYSVKVNDNDFVNDYQWYKAEPVNNATVNNKKPAYSYKASRESWQLRMDYFLNLSISNIKAGQIVSFKCDKEFSYSALSKGEDNTYTYTISEKDERRNLSSISLIFDGSNGDTDFTIYDFKISDYLAPSDKKAGGSAVKLNTVDLEDGNYICVATLTDGSTLITEAVGYTASTETVKHTLVHHAAVAATCTETGTGEYWKCEGDNGCNKLFSDENAETEIAEVPVISAKGHTEVTDIAVEPTCETDGKTAGSHCSVCNTVITAQTTISKLNHTWGAWSITTEPTFNTTGKAERICETDNTHKETVDVPVLSDREVWEESLRTEPTEIFDGFCMYISQYGVVSVTIHALTDKHFLIEYADGTAMVQSRDTGTYAVVFAAYDENDVMTSVELKPVTFKTAGLQEVESKNFTESDAKTVKVMLWDSLTGMKPLCSANGN